MPETIERAPSGARRRSGRRRDVPKLSQEDIFVILCLRGMKFKDEIIGELFGIRPSHVRQINEYQTKRATTFSNHLRGQLT